MNATTQHCQCNIISRQYQQHLQNVNTTFTQHNTTQRQHNNINIISTQHNAPPQWPAPPRLSLWRKTRFSCSLKGRPCDITSQRTGSKEPLPPSSSSFRRHLPTFYMLETDHWGGVTDSNHPLNRTDQQTKVHNTTQWKEGVLVSDMLKNL